MSNRHIITGTILFPVFLYTKKLSDKNPREQRKKRKKTQVDRRVSWKIATQIL